MKTATANAIKMLLRTDPTVTSEVRMAVIEAMTAAPKVAVDLTGEVTVADAAAYLGLSRTTLWRMCKRGEVASTSRGKKLFIEGAEVARMRDGAVERSSAVRTERAA